MKHYSSKKEMFLTTYDTPKKDFHVSLIYQWKFQSSLQPKLLNIPNYKGAYIVSRRLYSVKYVGPNVLIQCLDT